MRDDGSRLTLLGSLRGRPLAGVGLAVGLALLGLFARIGLDPVLPPGFPFLTFFPAIILTACLAGTRAGIVCALAAVAAAWRFLPAAVGDRAFDAANTPAVVVFLMVAAVDILLIRIMQRVVDRLSVERALTRSLYEQQRTLFEELQHRVANNLAFVSGLLRLQKRRVVAAPGEAGAVFDDAITRIDTMGAIHRRLYDPGAATQALDAHLLAMCRELLGSMGADHIDVTVRVQQLEVPLERLLPLSLLIAELVTNSVKHGFAGRQRGSIAIHAETTPEGQRLLIRDDGPGLAAGTDPGRGDGLGMRIVQGLAAQLGGKVAWRSDSGTLVEVALPASP